MPNQLILFKCLVGTHMIIHVKGKLSLKTQKLTNLRKIYRIVQVIAFERIN